MLFSQSTLLRPSTSRLLQKEDASFLRKFDGNCMLLLSDDIFLTSAVSLASQTSTTTQSAYWQMPLRNSLKAMLQASPCVSSITWLQMPLRMLCTGQLSVLSNRYSGLPSQHPICSCRPAFPKLEAQAVGMPPTWGWHAGKHRVHIASLQRFLSRMREMRRPCDERL